MIDMTCFVLFYGRSKGYHYLCICFKQKNSNGLNVGVIKEWSVDIFHSNVPPPLWGIPRSALECTYYDHNYVQYIRRKLWEDE